MLRLEFGQFLSRGRRTKIRSTEIIEIDRGPILIKENHRYGLT
jgi:hypothetical protein